MMRPPRNPFHYRVVEKIESDDTFLELFQPSALDIFDAGLMWDRLHILRSSQGGGKTSLLRLFTPQCLWRIWKGKDADRDLSELYTRLNDLGVYDRTGPKVLGITIPCKTPYSTLEHLDLRSDAKVRLFYALLDARCISEAVKGILELRGMRIQENLNRVEIPLNPTEEHTQIPLGKKGDELLKWAKDIETRIWKMVDEGEPNVPEGVGHHEVYSMQSLIASNLLLDGEAVVDRILLMFDDVHRLSQSQRTALQEYATTSRSTCAVWMAERLQVMQPHEVISIGAARNREIAEFNLADHWMKAAKDSPKVFEAIATRRMRTSTVSEQFAAIVRDPQDDAEWLNTLKNVHTQLQERLFARTNRSELFRNLEVDTSSEESILFTELVRLKSAEIIVERNIERQQLSLDIAEGLQMPKHEETKGVRAAAEYQLCREFRLPYYYGLEKMAKLSSSNVDQFLDVAGDVFEEVLAIRVVNKRPPISAKRQEQIVLQAARRRWDDIPKRIADGTSIQRLVRCFAEFALPQSLSKKASYAPGVTGFGITSDEHALLTDQTQWKKNPMLSEVATLLSRCVAHNILYMEPNLRQGTKGSTKTVFYLNRLLCAHFGLPLGYGGWRPRTPRQLSHWAANEHNLDMEDAFSDFLRSI